MGGFCSGIKSRVKIHTPLDIKKSLNLTLLFFDQELNFNCLSTVPFVKNIIHNAWSEETSSAACSLCLKTSVPWMTGCPHFDSCALSEREKNRKVFTSVYLQSWCSFPETTTNWGCFFQKNIVSLRNAYNSTWLNNHMLMTFKRCN